MYNNPHLQVIEEHRRSSSSQMPTGQYYDESTAKKRRSSNDGGGAESVKIKAFIRNQIGSLEFWIRQLNTFSALYELRIKLKLPKQISFNEQ